MKRNPLPPRYPCRGDILVLWRFLCVAALVTDTQQVLAMTTLPVPRHQSKKLYYCFPQLKAPNLSFTPPPFIQHFYLRELIVWLL